MVRVESLSDDQLTAKMSVLHCMLMSHGGELLARYRGLLLSHHEQVFGLNDNLYSSDASFAKSKAKRNERKKKIKSLTKSLDSLHAEDLVRKFIASDEFSRVQGELLSLAASAGFEHGLSMHQTKDEFSFMLKKMAHFVPGALGRLAEVSSLIAQTNYAFLNKIYKHAVEPL
ncbi:hypothetical protein Tco_0837781, partial [Tanacetum coccineum]